MTEPGGHALRCGRYALDGGRTHLMGVLNITPDSFSDGGLWLNPERAVEAALAMQQAGAAIIDVGGESTRPGATAVSAQQELDRVMPVIEALVAQLEIPVSVDTSKPQVMQAAVAAGVGMINDVRALREEGALACVAQAPDVAVVLMHMQGEPRSMQKAPHYDNVVGEVGAFLAARIQAAVEAGVERSRIVVDPGIGFGKRLSDNLALLAAMPELVADFGAVLIGVSRKSMFAQLLGDRPPQQRVAASVQVGMLAAQAGVSLLRVHDVRETAEALRLLQAIAVARGEGGV